MIDYVAFGAAVLLAAALLAAAWRGSVGPPASRTRGALRWLLAVLLVLPLVGLGAWRLSNARTVQVMGTIVPRVAGADSLVAITFDDGPLPAATERILSVLAEHDVRATFFLVGSAVAQHAGAAARIVEAGHEIGNHSWSHPVLIGLPLRRIRAELDSTDAAIRAAGFDGEIHFRSPYGKKFVALPWVLARSNRRNIFWDVEPESHADVVGDTDRIVAHVLDRTRPGSIILLHVMTSYYEPSLLAVPAILEGLKARGYTLVTVSELLGTGG